LSGKPTERWAEILIKLCSNAQNNIGVRKVSSSDLRGDVNPKVVTIDGSSSTSLDNKSQNSTWDAKARRTYSCALSGLKRCEYRGVQAYFLTLTSAPHVGNHAKHFDLLVKRVRRELGYGFEYMKVFTTEGNGVFHVLFFDAFEGWAFDAIHAYFSCLWQELHKSPIVWCSPVLLTKKVCSYVVQYAASQKGFVRKSCSKNWIFPAYRSVFIGLIKKFGFKRALLKWDSLLRYYVASNTTVQTSLLKG